ncbi:hypothetical protein LJB68_09475 [bacterium 210820-DFI.6.52]|nr:hypothetical protein [bacterium 210820-DFI.6.52]
MKKKWVLICNIVLLFWYFLSMTGLKLGNKYLVQSAFKDEWIFLLIPIITFILFLITKKIGKILHLAWLGMWFATQFFSHEWYSIFGNGFMGDVEGKIAYFKDCIQITEINGRYVPDVYHIVLHILIVIAFVVTILYSNEEKRKYTES